MGVRKLRGFADAARSVEFGSVSWCSREYAVQEAGWYVRDSIWRQGVVATDRVVARDELCLPTYVGDPLCIACGQVRTNSAS
eukprot:647156-Pyramimonas_sp.AAC.1